MAGTQSGVEYAVVHGPGAATDEELRPRVDVGGPELRGEPRRRAGDTGRAIQVRRSGHRFP